MHKLLHFVVTFSAFLVITCTENPPSVAVFLENLLTSDKYDKRVRPGIDSGKPTIVDVDVYINSISSINEVDMDYLINIYLRQTWTDTRLEYTEYNRTLTLNYNQFDRMWVPDLFIKNEKGGFFHKITVPNRLLKISPEGVVLYSQRLSLTLACNMYLGKYPMDNQTCKMEVESYGYTTDDLVFQWRGEDSVQVNEDLQLPEFGLDGSGTGDCTVEYITGTFSCVFAELHMSRKIQYYMVQMYIPTTLIVMLSWVSFWIDIYSVPARISLGLLTVLTMTTQSSGVSQRLPRVSYVKAIDVWMTTCLAFVFGALVEYSIVNVLARTQELDKDKDKKKEDNSEVVDNILTDKDNVTCVPVYPGSNPKGTFNGELRHRVEPPINSKSSPDPKLASAKKECKFLAWLNKLTHNRALMLDVMSRILFPLTFIVFAGVYWSVYYII